MPAPATCETAEIRRSPRLARLLLIRQGKPRSAAGLREGVDVSYDYERYEPRGGRRHAQPAPRTFDRLMDWLRDRPAESWLFFAAGVVLAMLFG
jgi:hypothetical protein